MEEASGWIKSIGQAKTRFHSNAGAGAFTLEAAYNMIRLPKLLAAVP